jgi:hypothetical protein
MHSIAEEVFMRLVILISVVLAGCYASGYDVGYSTGYGYGPSLVSIEPGVSVVADYDYPVFYANSYYWRFDNGRWYRSSNYRGGWRVWSDVPVAVRRIDRPSRYIHYRSPNRFARPEVREHRTGREPGWNARRPAPIIRDHRRDEGRRAPIVRDRRTAPPRAARPGPRPERRGERRDDRRDDRRGHR